MKWKIATELKSHKLKAVGDAELLLKSKKLCQSRTTIDFLTSVILHWYTMTKVCYCLAVTVRYSIHNLSF